VFLAGGFRLLSPLNKVLTGMTQAKLALPAVAQVKHDLHQVERFDAERRQLESVADGYDVVRPLVGNVSCRCVRFGYDAAKPVLDGLSLEIRAGSSVALVGGSGAGKTTLVDVLLGLLEPQSGAVLIDGIPLASVRARWQRSIGYVPQIIGLIDDTVRANIALGMPSVEIDDGRVWEVLRLAQVDDVVEAMASGLDTMIGEGGIRLSGGQRQRLGIARALYHDPKVLFLDEATSALDNETEAQVTETLRGLRGQMTMVTIAHRLSTIRDADAVHFMAAGGIVASGSFEQLTRSMPEFARLVNLATLPVAAS
jgi:ATP-binding cassette subfamily C protein